MRNPCSQLVLGTRFDTSTDQQTKTNQHSDLTELSLWAIITLILSFLCYKFLGFCMFGVFFVFSFSSTGKPCSPVTGLQLGLIAISCGFRGVAPQLQCQIIHSPAVVSRKSPCSGRWIPCSGTDSHEDLDFFESLNTVFPPVGAHSVSLMHAQ